MDTLCRVRHFSASGTSLQICSPSADRLEIVFYSDGAAFLRDGPEEATSALGIPITSGSEVSVRGSLARKRWTVVSAGTPRISVVEYFRGVSESVSSPAVPTGGY